MAESKTSGAENLMNLNPDMKVVKLKQAEESGGTGTQTEPWFKPKAGNVFPAKRKLVQTMIFDSLVQSFPVFHPRRPPSTDCFPPADDQGNSCFKKMVLPEPKKSKEIHPYPPYPPSHG